MPKGGLARRANIIKQERATNDGIVLVLDAGSSLSGQWASLKSEGKVMVDAMNLMAYDALAVGRMDLAIGLPALQERAAEAEFAILSDNLVDKVTNELFFEPYVLIERQGAKIAIIGVSEPEALQSPGVPDLASMLDPIEATRMYVEELRPQVDLLIVLSHMGKAQDHRLAASVPGIDIIVGGNDRELMRAPETEGTTLIVQQGSRGEWMGRLSADYDAQGRVSNVLLEVLTLDDNYADDEDMVALLKPYREQYPTPTPQPTWTPDPRTPTVDMTKTIEAFQTQAAVLRTQTAQAEKK